MRTNRLVPVAAISVLLVACGSAASPTAPATSSPTAPGTIPSPVASSPTTTPSAAAPTPGGSIGTEPPAPTAEASATAEPAPSLSSDLESLMPTEIAGQTMTIEPASDPGNSFLILWNDEQIAQDLLDSLGKTADDADVVFAYASDADFPETLSVNAYRVAGADGEALRQGMAENYVAMIPGWTATPETLAGKDVIALGPATATPGSIPQYFYAVGDIVFTIQGNPPEWVEEALGQLP